MIELTCTKCAMNLSIDDAFAGGVCRCRHCGAIQTVPKQTKRTAVPASISATGRPDTVDQATTTGTGLDELAHVVASSGLSGTGLSASRLRKPTPPPAVADASSRRQMMVLIAIGGTILLLLCVILVILLNRGGGETRRGDQARASPGAAGPSAAATGASFLGMPLRSSSVVYLLDRGTAMEPTFDAMRVATQNSLATLPPSMKFQVIFWHTDEVLAIPAMGLQPATPAVTAEARSALVDVYAFGQSRVEPALERALSQSPDEILLVTGKSGLDDGFVKSALALRRTADVKIHTFSLGQSGSPDALRAIANQTRGEFREIPLAELRQFAQ